MEYSERGSEWDEGPGVILGSNTECLEGHRAKVSDEMDLLHPLKLCKKTAQVNHFEKKPEPKEWGKGKGAWLEYKVKICVSS